MHSLRVNPSFSSVSGSPLLHPCLRMNIAVVHDANIGNLCLHLCFQLNMLIVFNQQRCCFISMFCATYSLSDNVVITRIFPTSKLGDDPSFFELPFDSTIWWNPLIFLRIISVFSGSITYPLCFIKGVVVGWGEAWDRLPQFRGVGMPSKLPSCPGEPAGGSSKVGGGVEGNGCRLLGVGFGHILWNPAARWLEIQNPTAVECSGGGTWHAFSHEFIKHISNLQII